MYEFNSMEDVITFLKNRDLSHFRFKDGKAYLDIYSETPDAIGLCADAPDNTIPEETVSRMLDVLTHFDECLRKAYGWLNNLRFNDTLFAHLYPKWYPDEMDKIYEKELELYEISFGKIRWGHDPNPVTDGFTISFMDDAGGWAMMYTVKFVYEDMRPIAAERWIKVF